MSAPRYPGDLLEHLRGLVVLSALVLRRERGAFTRAAQALGLDVSVLRRRVQTLEAYVGGPVLLGRGPRLALTPLGQRVVRDGERALALVTELSAKHERPAPRLRVACTGTFLAEVLPPLLGRLRREHPALVLSVLRRGSHESLALLRDGELDLAIVRAESAPRGLSSTFLGKDRLWVGIPAAHPLARARRLGPEQLSLASLVGYPLPSFTMERVTRVLAPRGERAPFIEVSGKAAALAYVAAGLGIAFVSALSGQQPTHRGVVMRDVTSLFSPASFWLAWRARERAPWELSLERGLLEA